jgi:outer membrane protein assembly factor BamB
MKLHLRLESSTDKDCQYFYKDKTYILSTNHFGGLLGIRINNDVELWLDEDGYYCELDTVTFKIIKKFKAKFEGIYPQFFKDGNIFILKNQIKTVVSLCLTTGDYIWELDFGKKINGFSRIEGNEISKIIGLSGEELLLSLSDFSLVSVNSNTGKIIWNFNREQMEEILNQSTFLTIQGFENGSIENHQLYILHGGCYIIFDLATQKGITLWKASGIYEELSIVQTVFTNEYIYFTGAFGFPFNPNLLGVFNRQTLKVDWLHEGTELPQVGGYRGSYRQIKVSEDKIYALDDSEVSSGTLHIFEKTEDN